MLDIFWIFLCSDTSMQSLFFFFDKIFVIVEVFLEDSKHKGSTKAIKIFHLIKPKSFPSAMCLKTKEKKKRSLLSCRNLAWKWCGGRGEGIRERFKKRKKNVRRWNKSVLAHYVEHASGESVELKSVTICGFTSQQKPGGRHQGWQILKLYVFSFVIMRKKLFWMCLILLLFK